MLRPLAFVAMRQQHHQTADAAPFRLSRRNELVDHHLGAVGEIAKLRFPDNQIVGLGARITVLESEHRLLRQHRIDDDEITLVLGDVGQRDIGARVPALAILVMQNRMAVRKGTASAVLPRQADAVAIGDQGRIGKRFGHAPVHRQLALAHLAAGSIKTLHRRVHLEPLWDSRKFVGEALQLCHRHMGIRRIGPFGPEEGRPVDGEFALEIGQHRV